MTGRIRPVTRSSPGPLGPLGSRHRPDGGTSGRRSGTRTILPLLALAWLTCTVSAADPTPAISKGLQALIRQQRPDGLIGEGAGISALAGMALLAGGHTPTRGEYRDASNRCLRAVLAKQDAGNGYLGGDQGHSGMYGHGFATLYLAECYGMAGDVPVRRALEAAVDCIHRAQNREGGWRYTPFPNDADLSVTICQVMALRAAYNVGIGGEATVEAVRRAVEYVRSCQNGDGSFAYLRQSVGQGGTGPEGVPRTAAGIMSLVTSGVTDLADQSLGPAYAMLRRQWRDHLQLPGAQNFYWYGQYYTAQALFHSGDPDDWRAYWDAAQPALLARQGADGLWLEGEGPGPVYPTAMALIILQIPNEYLPIFQR